MTRGGSRPDLGDYRRSLLESLEELAATMRQLPVLSKIFDADWFSEIRDEIQTADLSDGSFRSQRCPLFFLFKDDPTLLRCLDSRLSALSLVDPSALWNRVEEIRSCRFSRKQLEHLFELVVLGVFAQQNCLRQMHVPLGRGSVDGLLILRERPVLIEATLTTQQLLSSEPGVSSIGVETLTDQIERKVRKKVAEGQQLALAGNRPSILVMGLHPFGADQVAARWGIKGCFGRPEFASSSAIVVSDSWKFFMTQLHLNPDARNPLDAAEVQRLRACLQAASKPQRDYLDGFA